MGITLPVEGRADVGSFDRVAEQAQKRLGKAGKDAGQAFAKGLEEATAKADPKAAERFTKAYDKVADAAGNVRVQEAKLADLRERGAGSTKLIQQSEALEKARRAETRATREAASAYIDLKSKAGGFLAGIGDAISGTRFGGMIDDVQRLNSVFGGLGLATGAAITGVAGLAVGIGAATTKLYQLGAEWDNVADSITARTGMMGEDLGRVMDQVSRVALDSATSIAELGNIAGQVVALMGASGDQVGELTAYIGDLNALTGEQTNIRQLSMLYRVFGITAGEQVGTLNDLYGAFTKTQIPVNDLVGLLVKAGPTFKQYNMDIDQTVSMLTQFTEAGVDPEKAVTGLSKALKTVTDMGGEPSAVLAQVIAQIKEMTAAGNLDGARTLASDFFGAKNFQPFLDAIQSGKVSVEQLNTVLQQTDVDIREVRASTDDFTEQWDRFKNFLSVDLAPAATTVFDALNDQLEIYTSSLRSTVGLFRSLFGGGPSIEGYTATYPGQVVTPAIPGGETGSIVPPSGGAITGNGTYLDSILGGGAGLPAPAGLLPDQALPPVTPGSDGAGGGIGGGGGSRISLPYPAEYGGPRRPGESDEQYQARMADILAQHNLAEAQARANQLSGDATAEAGELVTANNAVTDARMRADEAARRYQQSLVTQPGSIAVPLDPAFAAGPRPGQSSAEYGAESTYLDAQQKKAQALAEEQQLMASGTATANELTAAHNEVIRAQQNENEAALRLSEAYAKTSEQGGKMSTKLGEIGASLDADLGISKGLAGVAENITRFVANLAFAPMIGALKGVQASTGVDPSKAGSGLIGMAAAAAGFGVAPTAGAAAAPTGVGRTVASPRISPTAAAGSYPGDAALLAMVPKGGRYDASGDLIQGLADCTSGVEDLVNLLDGRSTAGRNMHTNADVGGKAAEWLLANGFVPTDVPMPGTFQVGFNAGHMEATLPGGTPVNFGSDAAVASGGTAGATGAWAPGFTSHFYRPVTGGIGGMTAMPGSAILGGQSIPLPLPVTIVGGGGGAGVIPSPPTGTATTPGGATPGSGAARPGGTGASASGSAPSGTTSSGAYVPLTESELADPGLTNPVPAGGGGSTGGGIATQLFPGIAGAPQSGRGGGAGTGGLLPGLAGPPQASTVGGITPAGGRGEGGLGIGGGLAGMAMSALQAAAGAGGMGANMMAPGAGAAISAAADIGIKLANRGAQFAGQAAGIGVGGIMEALLPVESSMADPMNSWFGRIIGGMMGAAPNLPNMAGQAANAPQNGQNGQGQQVDNSKTFNLQMTSPATTEDRKGADLVRHLTAMNTGPGM